MNALEFVAQHVAEGAKVTVDGNRKRVTITYPNRTILMFWY